MRRGWTLIEVVVVLLVLVLGAAVALPAYRSLAGTGAGDIDDATRRLETLFRLARDSAVRAGTSVTVIIDSAGGRVWLDALTSAGAEDWEPPVTSSRMAGVRPATSRPRSTGPSRAAGEETRAADAYLDLPVGVRLELPRARASFTFAPGGQFSGDSVVLRSGLETRTITLDPWTGDVRVR